MTLARRVAALELQSLTSRHRAAPMPIIAANRGETTADAIERHVVANGPLPHQPPGRMRVIVLEAAYA